MRYLILSDPHANLPALNAVLADASGMYDQAVCCGDVVGYNANPKEVSDWVRSNCAATVRGNHDKVVAGIDSLEWFNEVAQAAALWTTRQFDEGRMNWLRELPQGPMEFGGFAIWHGSPTDEDEYVTSSRTAAERFPAMLTGLGFFGHTHVQGGFFSRYGRAGVIPQVPHRRRESFIELEPDSLYMINPGSVGQPRDGDPRAAYAIYDSENRSVALRRVEYRASDAAAAIAAAGLPDVLGLRLLIGR